MTNIPNLVYNTPSPPLETTVVDLILILGIVVLVFSIPLFVYFYKKFKKIRKNLTDQEGAQSKLQKTKIMLIIFSFLIIVGISSEILVIIMKQNTKGTPNDPVITCSNIFGPKCPK